MFLKVDTATLTTTRGRKHALLWGDPVEVLEDTGGDTLKVRAHGGVGPMKRSLLVDDLSLLEIYVIDVGQGDAILVRTPDDKWHLVDGGPSWSSGMLDKGAPNFIGWKFAVDLQREVAAFETVVMSHPDLDHYGGLANVLASSFGPKRAGQRPLAAQVTRFLHPGVGRYIDGIGRDGAKVTALLSDKASFENPPRTFGEDFAKLAAGVVATAGDVQRVSRDTRFVPGYETGKPVVMHVLGPVAEADGTVRWLGSQSETINGHSVVLRLDYGKARILLTGDINTVAQEHLLGHVPAAQYAADVVKGCHHGAEDVLPRFFKAMKPRATVISSGDQENYAHPRPAAVGAYGRYGRHSQGERPGEVWPPLVYSTELARSIQLAHVTRVKVQDAVDAIPAGRATVKVTSETAYRQMADSPVATDMIYGLVNVRTDGKRILCATRNERNTTFDVKAFAAGATVPSP